MRVFFLIVWSIPVLTGLWWWWADARLRRLPASPVRRAARWLVALSAGAFLLSFAYYLLARFAELAPLPRGPLVGFVMLWALLGVPLFVVPTMLVWLGWKGGAAVHRMLRGKPADLAIEPATQAMQNPGAGAPRRLTRREALTAAVVTLPATATLGATLYSTRLVRKFRVREIDVAVPALPAGLDGMTIAHVSDVHVGRLTYGAVLDDIAGATNDLAADLVLMTGDLLDQSIRDLPEALRMVEKLDRRSGLFLVEGNHDLFDGREAFTRGVRDADVPLLLDESATVVVRGERVQLLGMRWHGRFDAIEPYVDRVTALRDTSAFPILLAHHPHAFDRAAELGVPLTLAGHTHGGQLMLTPELGFGSWMFRYWSGLYTRGASSLVVSNGVGNWFPIRQNAPAEIVRITLRRV